MNHSATVLTASLVLLFSFFCCCCGGLGSGFDGFDQGVVENLLEGNLDDLVEEIEQASEPGGGDQESGEAVPVEEDEAVAPVEDVAEATEDEGSDDEAVAPAEEAVEAPEGEGSDDEVGEEFLEALEEHMEEGGDEPFTFGCDNPDIPMPPDIVGCVSIAGVTMYSTGMSEADVDKMYDDFFIDRGWEHFPQVVQEDVINAWTRDGMESYAILAFMAGEGEDGKNMVNVAVMGEQ